jgi:predicted enzyme related to lactoylglutathione lyase
LDGCYDHTVGISDTDYGRCACVYDPEGNTFELLEPKG